MTQSTYGVLDRSKKLKRIPIRAKLPKILEPKRPSRNKIELNIEVMIEYYVNFHPNVLITLYLL